MSKTLLSSALASRPPMFPEEEIYALVSTKWPLAEDQKRCEFDYMMDF
jgi:hypothetical protein